MQVNLDPDPLQYGPKRLNNKVAECRGFLSRCERIFLDLSQHLHRLRREHLRTSEDYDLQFKDLIANDPETRAGRNVADREATASMKLRSEKEKINQLAIQIQDLETVVAIVKAKRLDLKDIQNRIKDQFKICQEEIGLGSRWGSRTSTVPQEIPEPTKPVSEEESMESLVEDALQAVGKSGGAFDNSKITPSPLIQELSSPHFPTKKPEVKPEPVTVENTPKSEPLQDVDSLLESIVPSDEDSSGVVSVEDLFS